jgi:hypothetical protein
MGEGQDADSAFSDLFLAANSIASTIPRHGTRRRSVTSALPALPPALSALTLRLDSALIFAGDAMKVVLAIVLCAMMSSCGLVAAPCRVASAAIKIVPVVGHPAATPTDACAEAIDP